MIGPNNSDDIVQALKNPLLMLLVCSLVLSG